jgi:hypothetical protein
MLKESASGERHGALTGHGRLTISPAFTSVPRLIRRGVNLAPVRRHEATYSSPRAPRIGQRLNVPKRTPRLKTLPAHHLAGAHNLGATYS